MQSTPDTAAGWEEAGNQHFLQQRWKEAADSFRRCVAHDANNAAIWCRLGLVEQNAGNWELAAEAYEQSLSLAPENAEARLRLALLLNQKGRPREAIAAIEQVLSKNPKLAVGWLILGHSYDLLNDLAQATSAYRRAVELAPDSHEHRYQLADALLRQFQIAEAEDCLNTLLAARPHDADAWALLGLALRIRGAHRESLAAFEKSLAIRRNPHHHSKLLLGMQYDSEITPQTLLAAHKDWDVLYGRAAAAGSNAAARRPRDAGSKMRLGFVSADFYQHPIAFLVLPVLEAIDRSRVSVICYSDRALGDDYTARFRRCADSWMDICGMSDDRVADAIRRDEIDILFDLSGHVGERLGVFTRKPARRAVTWLGYVGTTGLSTIDYLLADWHHVRAGEESWYTETVLRMPQGYACYAPPPDAPVVGPLPAVAANEITFGCFNNPMKFSSVTIEAWSDILKRVPRSRLLLKFGWLDDAKMQDRLRGQFRDRGIEPARITFEGISGHWDHLAAYHRIDIALDTQPYSGGLTTCEALWMGVPVVTSTGKTFAGRHSTSHLMSAGLPEFVAADQSSYIEMAVNWASRLHELAELRATLRERMRRSPLCNAAAFAHDFVPLLERVSNQPVTQPNP
jgi:protein O-GlcNAc transferase